MNLLIQKTPLTDRLMALLLLADETHDAINRYINSCILYKAVLEDDDVAIVALYAQNCDVLEIKNIAVDQLHQNRGIGRELIQYTLDYACRHNYKRVLVGTGDVNWGQLSFYEKCGFKPFGIRQNFYIENYPKPIYDAGKQLVDMVVLSLDII